MRYKGAYSPSQILDPETYHWHSFDDDFRKRLDTEKYITDTSDETTKPSTTSQDHDDTTIMADGDSDFENEEDEWGYSRTVFSTKMSGTMTREMVNQRMDLGRMGIQLRGRTAIAQVGLSNLLQSNFSWDGDYTRKWMLINFIMISVDAVKLEYTI